MGVEINWLGVIFATASSMVVGAIWYTPAVFGRKWEKLVGLNEKKMKADAGQAIAITVVVSFLTAYILAHVTFLSNRFFANSYLQDALATAFWLWLGMVAARFITHDAFERRPVELTILNISHELVTLLVMGVAIGVMHP